MKRPWRAIAWGMLVLLVDIRLVAFDIVPDALGFLLVIRGLAALPPNRVPKALALSGLGSAALLSLIAWAGGYADGPPWEPTVPDIGYFLSMAAGAAHVVMAYGLLELLAASVDPDRRALKAGIYRLWHWYLTVHALYLIVTPFLISQFASSGTWAVVLPLTLAIWIAEIALVRLLFRKLPSGQPA